MRSVPYAEMPGRHTATTRHLTDPENMVYFQDKEGKMLMDMHGMFYDFPITFSAENISGLKPISSHLRYIPDFCEWNGQLVLATDETSVMQNKFAGRAQSNLWFGMWEDLKSWGSATG